MNPDDVRPLVQVAELLAREAGALILDGRRRHVSVAATKSSAQDVVTAMDLASEALLRRRLAELRPDDGILGEEEGFQPGTSGVTWVVDPIDGTVNYLYGLPAYAVSVAAVVHARRLRRTRPRAPGPCWPAACFAPEDGRTYTAGRGLGAWLDGRALRVNAARPLIDSLVGHRLRIHRVPAHVHRPGSSRNCCRRYVIFVASDRPPSTCARSPRAVSTCTTSAACSPGTWRPVRSSPRRQVRRSQACAGSRRRRR